ncbi:MAG: hypothetical protein ACQETQ_13520 [Spirochaetota bacterium]
MNNKPVRHVVLPLVALVLTLGSTPASAEVLAPPPVPLDPWAAPRAPAAPRTATAGKSEAPEETERLRSHDDERLTGAFPATYSWLGIKRYTYDTGAPLFSYDLDLGAHILFYGNEHLLVSGLGRMLFQSQTAPGRPLYLDPSAVVTDLQLRARFPALPLRPALWYRHDCKHDMERESRRQAIHDVIGAGAAHRFSPVAGKPGLELLVDVSAEAYVPPIFQDKRTSANRAAGYLLVRPELAIHPGGPIVFTEVRAGLIVDDPDSAHATAGLLRRDASGRIGISWPEPTGGMTGYVEVERLTDPWRKPPQETESHVLVSFGAIVGVEGSRTAASR